MKNLLNTSLTKLLFTLLFLIIMFIVFNSFGLWTSRSGVRTSWSEHKNNKSWSAKYGYFSGYCEGKLKNGKENGTLHIESQTNSGSLKLEIKDTQGNVLFTIDELGDTAQIIEVPGTIKIKLIAEKHSGSFNIYWTDN